MVTMVTDRRPILEPESARGSPNAKRSAEYRIWLYNRFYTPPIVMLMPPSFLLRPPPTPPYGNVLNLV